MEFVLYLCIMKIKLYTPMSELSLSQVRDICKFGIEFCSKELGVNRRHMDQISFSIRTDRRFRLIYYGEYCPIINRIYIFRNNIENVKDMIQVFIHEYTHSLQPIKTKYSKMLNQYGYDNHPHEIEANRNADELYEKFFKLYSLK